MPTKRLRRGVFNICGIKDVVYKRYFAVPFVQTGKKKKVFRRCKKNSIKFMKKFLAIFFVMFNQYGFYS